MSTSIHEFTKAVGEYCEREYDITDCADLCYNLISMGVIDWKNFGIAEAARHCAQLIEQQ